MKIVDNMLVLLIGSVIVFSSCNTSPKQSHNSKDSLEVENQVVTSDDSEEVQEQGIVPAQERVSNDARRKAERSLAQANIEIEMEHNKIEGQ